MAQFLYLFVRGYIPLTMGITSFKHASLLKSEFHRGERALGLR